MNQTLLRNPAKLRRAGAVSLVTIAAAALAGCTGGIGAQLTFNDVVKTKVSQILLDSGSGDVQISTGPVTETRITRIVHSSTDPQLSYHLTGSQLRLGGTCGHDCWVSYQIEAPAGVAVTGQLSSGALALDGVAADDVQVTSGDIVIRHPVGPVKATATSGTVTVIDPKGPATVVATSGDVHVRNAAGPVDIRATSGDVDVKLAVPASVTASVDSGDLVVTVPRGAYQVHAGADSGDREVSGITDDPTSKNVLNLRASSGDVTVAAVPAA
jgi:hypothetical protein